MPTPPVNPQEAARRIAALRKHKTHTAAAIALGMPRSTLQRWDHDGRRFSVPKPIANPEPKPKTVVVERMSSADEKELAELRKKIAAIDAAREAVEAKTWSVKRVDLRDDALVPVIMLSDWHVGESVSRSDVPGGLNEYSVEIAEKRAKKLAERAAWVLTNSGSMLSRDSAVLCLGGDFITGWIHEELQASSVMSPLEELRLATRLIKGFIDHILSATKITSLTIATCHGNHGRTTMKMHIKGSAATSYEHHMYVCLRDHYAGDKRITWHIGQAYHTLFQIGDIKVRLHHGDGLKSQGGVGGVAIPLNKAVARYNSALRADLDIIGHFHQLLDGGSWVINGSLIGYTAYAAKIGCQFEEPRQALILVHPKRGKAGVIPLWCDS